MKDYHINKNIVENIFKMNRVIGLVYETRRSTFFSKVISIFTASRYIHVEFLLENNYTYGSKNFIGVGIDKTNSFKNPEYLHFNESLIFDDKIQFELKKNMLNEYGKGYDILAVMMYPFRRIFNNKDKWYCSEFIYYICKNSGINLINVYEEDKVISPKDLTHSLILRKV